jgi:hypothetical protein
VLGHNLTRIATNKNKLQKGGMSKNFGSHYGQNRKQMVEDCNNRHIGGSMTLKMVGDSDAFSFQGFSAFTLKLLVRGNNTSAPSCLHIIFQHARRRFHSERHSSWVFLLYSPSSSASISGVIPWSGPCCLIHPSLNNAPTLS